MTTLVLVIVAVVAVLGVRSWWFPYGPCPRCTRQGRGKAGRGFGSGGQAWNRCGACAGSGERIRPLARVWPQHRAEASKRKQARRK